MIIGSGSLGSITQAELFFSRTFIEGIKFQYMKLGKEVTLIRSENTDNASQPFFKEQLVHQLKVDCFFGNKPLGSLYICGAERSGQ